MRVFREREGDHTAGRARPRSGPLRYVGRLGLTVAVPALLMLAAFGTLLLSTGTAGATLCGDACDGGGGGGGLETESACFQTPSFVSVWTTDIGQFEQYPSGPYSVTGSSCGGGGYTGFQYYCSGSACNGPVGFMTNEQCSVGTCTYWPGAISLNVTYSVYSLTSPERYSFATTPPGGGAVSADLSLSGWIISSNGQCYLSTKGQQDGAAGGAEMFMAIGVYDYTTSTWAAVPVQTLLVNTGLGAGQCPQANGQEQFSTGGNYWMGTQIYNTQDFLAGMTLVDGQSYQIYESVGCILWSWTYGPIITSDTYTQVTTFCGPGATGGGYAIANNAEFYS